MKININVEVDSVPELVNVMLAMSTAQAQFGQNQTTQGLVGSDGAGLGKVERQSDIAPPPVVPVHATEPQSRKGAGSSLSTDSLSKGDGKFKNMKTLRQVVVALKEDSPNVTVDAVLARCRQMRDSDACAVLAVIQEEDLEDRVRSACEQLGIG